MRTRIGSAALVAALTFAGVAVASTPAGAADSHAITVTPDSGLVDGQSVTVGGTGFVETPIINDWFAAECSGAILTDGVTLDNALKDCDVTTQPFVFVHADADGNLSTPLTVRKTFTTSSNIPVTCGQGADQCAILVSQLTEGGILRGAAAAISFGPPPPSTIADCFRAFAHDHNHSPRVKAVHLLLCVLGVLFKHH
jgi:Neocarzinostatin family